MSRLAANLTMLFTELPFLDRFAAAAEAGFTGVEFLFPYDHTPEDVARAKEAAGVEQALFNLPPGDWDAGDRGMAAIPGREDEFRAGLGLALEYADALDCPRLHAMAGILPEGSNPMKSWNVYRDNLTLAAETAEAAGRMILIEPINTKVTMPGYALATTQAAEAILHMIDKPCLGLQLDLFHMQIMEGVSEDRLRTLMPITKHVQIADTPDRHEPGTGDMGFPDPLLMLDGLGYDGWIGCEYTPAAGTLAGLGWADPYLKAS
ncbi:2-oxo-tetronate isomerase [Tropicimonas sp. S265A]|uniref:2-oxo-tetronate isomerase n=1 Tax=Tropicimonas sp. S265A TaxID=3415134 RepID=UPI003C7E5E8D